MKYLGDKISNGTEESFGIFDDERILKGQVSVQERQDLEKKLLGMYLNRAIQNGKGVTVVTDKIEYEGLRRSGELFDGDKFYLLMNHGKTRVIDMTPLAYHLRETKEGNFYAKLILQDGHHQT